VLNVYIAKEDFSDILIVGKLFAEFEKQSKGEFVQYKIWTTSN
jgi:hypothetical protein